MRFTKKFTKEFVYSVTKKPDCYVRVDNPKTLQDLRQIQYNNWCKAKGVYSGSYLPANPDLLQKNGKKGWQETTNPRNTTGDNREFTRMSTGQVVRHEKTKYIRNKTIDEHYHWLTANSKNQKRKNQKNALYYDRYGKTCAEGSKESHLAPFDKNYNFR